MGLIGSYLSFIDASIERTFGAARGLRMLELGDQVVADAGIPESTGKEYFQNRGFEHVSVDLNGLHGALVRDLTRPEQFLEWHGSFAVVTNAGTSEHVEPYEAQYDCFRIVHDCLEVGGLAVHVVPDVEERDTRGVWKDHCRYYYSRSFFEMLARECGYELLSTTLINGHRCAALRKTEAPFMSDRPKFLEGIARREYSNRLLILARDAWKGLKTARLRWQEGRRRQP